jgi:pyridoxamine 5'-phosphate oxidase
MNPSAHPADFFEDWLTQALAARPTAHAMSLATATREGQTSLRTVLLKAYGRDGFLFFTATDTLKVRQLTENPHASLLFFWPESHRQVRIDGTAARVPPASLARRVLSRGAGHESLRWVSPLGRLADAREVLGIGAHGACGFLVSPCAVCFWQGGTGRRHATLDYERVGDDWIRRISGPADLQAALGLPSTERHGAAS